ncbi:hypothetical protein FRB94_000037 [Tulasnella sp. JGI-2019a]|nr:hypothetical protein FRB94_000037 [Tulasnella sp. JGI-2019a]KAG9015724.1 hypothetical protein FRB93_012288 [Tulasnella sp. JGI-2019a]
MPEILDVILRNASMKSKARAARTCQKWFSPAVDALWRDLDSPVPLIKLLSTNILTSISSRAIEEIKFSRSIADADWSRFGIYSSRVRTLRYDDGECIAHPRLALGSNIFTELGVYRPPGALLPNLVKLEWRAVSDHTARGILQFIPVRLESLVLTIGHRVNPTVPCQVITALSRRTETLQHLEFRSDLPPQLSATVKNALATWLRRVPRLLTIGLPSYYGTTEIVDALATLGDLEKIYTSHNWFEVSPYSALGTTFTFQKNFPKVKELSVDLNLPIDPLSLRSHHLVRLCINTLIRDVGGSLQEMLGIVATGCPNLEDLQLMLGMSDDFGGDEEGEGRCYICYDDITPLLACRRLVQLQVAHCSPIKLEEAQLKEMGKSWPGMTTLELCQSPNFKGEPFVIPGMPLSMLRTIVKAFRSLETFGTFFLLGEAGDLEPVPRDDDNPSLSLRTLDVGSSDVDEDDLFAIGYYIGLLCPALTAVTANATNVRWYPINVPSHRDVDPELVERTENWNAVESIVKATTRLHGVFQRRIEELSEKLEASQRQLAALRIQD